MSDKQVNINITKSPVRDGTMSNDVTRGALSDKLKDNHSTDMKPTFKANNVLSDTGPSDKAS